MNLSWPSKDPGEVLDFSWPVPLDDGDTISGTPTATVIAGTVSLSAVSVANGLVSVVISGGQPSENAIVNMTAQTVGGRTFVEEFLLKITAASAVPTDADNLRADIAKLNEAMMNLALGKQIKEVWRNGRRIIYGVVTAETITAMINLKQRALDGLIATESGRPRRRAISLGWPN